ncbi:MAG: glycosyltransferase [Planctomycetaceae bacterium]|nr:glycosyltransferase [Planctomycetaceae bacterium]
MQPSLESQSPTPMVSVILLTYNHEPYIANALRSILMQDFTEPAEVLVADDCSTDGTRAIIAGLLHESTFPIRVLDRPENLGLSRNLEDAMRQAQGKYISILEGDDSWCDRMKLRRTMEQLEANSNWVGCFHAVRVVDGSGKQTSKVLPESLPTRVVQLTDLLSSMRIPTYSCVTYRRGIVTSFPAWHYRVACGDWGLHLMHARHGPFGFLPEVMTNYRVHAAGMWSGMGEVWRLQQQLELLRSIDQEWAGEFSVEICRTRDQLLSEFQQNLTDLRRIERRYHLLQLDRIASGLRWLKGFWRRSSPPS